MLKEGADLQAMIGEIADFFEIVIAYISELLAKFEKHFTFEEENYNKYPVEETTTL